MRTSRSGIFGWGTSSHVYLEWDIAENRAARELVSAVASLREPKTTIDGVFCRDDADAYFAIVANIITAAAAMTAVASHPKPFNHSGNWNLPTTEGRAASHMMAAITGTATTPLITALQKSIFIGLKGVKLSTIPLRVATAITA